MSGPPPEDAAWVSIDTPLAKAQLLAFCRKPELLLRINSTLELVEWRALGPSRFFMRARHLADNREFGTPLRVEATETGCRLVFERGLKSATEFRVEAGATGAGARLVVLDDYSTTPAAERAARLDEVDRGLTQWGGDLRRYFLLWRLWSWLAPWRWYMERVWPRMKPASRRLVFILLVVSAAELAALLLLVAVYQLESGD